MACGERRVTQARAVIDATLPAHAGYLPLVLLTEMLAVAAEGHTLFGKLGALVDVADDSRAVTVGGFLAEVFLGVRQHYSIGIWRHQLAHERQERRGISGEVAFVIHA